MYVWSFEGEKKNKENKKDSYSMMQSSNNEANQQKWDKIRSRNTSQKHEPVW